MNARLLALRERRGGLRARCAQQRETLAGHAEALAPVFSVADVAWRGAVWVKRNPVPVGAVVFLLVLLRPQRVQRLARLWRWSRRLSALKRAVSLEAISAFLARIAAKSGR